MEQHRTILESIIEISVRYVPEKPPNKWDSRHVDLLTAFERVRIP